MRQGEPPRQGTDRWRAAALFVASGASVLGIGLLLGPTPSADAAQALRDISAFRDRYVATNAIDFVGILVMGAGLVAMARLQLRSGGGAEALLGGVANAAGAVLIALTVVLQSTVDPLIASRFVEASGSDQRSLLTLGEAAMEISGAVFGVGFLLQMLGIALLAITFHRGAGPAVNRAFLAAGAVLALAASTMGIAALFADVLGEVEALLGLAVLLWLVALSGLLIRLDRP